MAPNDVLDIVENVIKKEESLEEKIGLRVTKSGKNFVARADNLFGSDVPIGIGRTEDEAKIWLMLNLFKNEEKFLQQLAKNQHSFVM